jgi:regulator of cell morphogenesis and NO signaling
MTPIDPSTALGELVADEPARATVFERLGFDYCCGGGRTLAEAAAERGLDPATVAAMLEAVSSLPAEDGQARDWREATVGELCDHIVEVHHAALWRDLPRIAELARKVERVHGSAEPELAEVRRHVDALRAELAAHMASEEEELFPAIRALAEGAGSAPSEDALAEHEAEHEQVGATLTRLRELTGGYDRDRARCGTHRVLLDSLQGLEVDLHRHIHEENNILFPRARKLAAGVA